MVTLDSQFMLWGSAYVLLKWTVGMWVFRQAKAYVTRQAEPELENRFVLPG
jgi:hypothetical protein